MKEYAIHILLLSLQELFINASNHDGQYCRQTKRPLLGTNWTNQELPNIAIVQLDDFIDSSFQIIFWHVQGMLVLEESF